MMQVSVAQAGHAICEERVTAFVAPVFEDDRELAAAALNPDDARTLSKLHASGIISGKPAKPYFLPTPNQGYRGVLALGLGKKDALTAETLRRAAGAACALLRDHQVSALVFDASQHAEMPVEALLEGIVLGQYRCDRYKSQPDEDPRPVIEHATVYVHRGVDLPRAQKRCERAVRACENANWARDLAAMPGNELTPVRLADIAHELAASVGCACEILDEHQMADIGMGALLGVARGSATPPRLILLSHMPNPHGEIVAILGKGVTFDTGGISIKPGDGMHEMKYDMCGAAAVLGAMKTLCELKIPVNVVAAIPAVENMPSGTAQRPGDIVRACNGKTIEVHNTDAEGRLILADALAYVADRFRPDRMVDAATLTGGAITALGHSAACYMATDDDLAEALELAADVTGERIWRLPLWEDHAELIKGVHADICNIGPPRDAVPIVGGAFLQPFTAGIPWAHIDIAGTAWDVKNVPYLDARQPTGYGVRLLTQWIAGEIA